MTRHKWADLIHAWAEGAEIQKFCGDGWYNDSDTPEWFEDCEYRIKPRAVKMEGWVNIYRLPGGELPSTVCCVHPTEEAAKTFAGIGTVARVRVEWEEEE